MSTVSLTINRITANRLDALKSKFSCNSRPQVLAHLLREYLTSKGRAHEISSVFPAGVRTLHPVGGPRGNANYKK